MSGTMGIIVWPMACTSIKAREVECRDETGTRAVEGWECASGIANGDGITELKGKAVRLVCFLRILRVASFVAY